MLNQLTAFLVTATIASGLLAQDLGPDTDWRSWRGPNGNGIAAAGQSLPVAWDATQNVIWKTPVPGRGHSSPTVVGNRIFLATADEGRQAQSVVAFDRETGRQLWQTEVARGGFPAQIHRKNTHATGTVASDGQHLFIAFYSNGGVQAAALSLQGKELWKRTLGPFSPRQYKYGYAPSPTIHGDLVIFAADYDGGGYLTALDRKSGQPRWRASRPAKLSFSSPIVAKVAGRDQLLISGCDMIASYDPATGKPFWSTAATTMATCGTMIWEGDLVFASGGYPKPETVCVRGDGSGQVVWKNKQKCYEQSMLVYQGHIYAVTDGGVAYCWRARDGKEMWKSRLTGSPISSSPILAGGNIYVANERGTMFVFRADPTRFQLAGENQLGDECFATPAVCGNRIYLRVADQSGGRHETLYCIGQGG